MRLFILLFCTAALIAACSPDSDGTPKIAGSQRQVLDKAKAVDSTVQDSADAEKQKMDEQTE
jgi:ABC-type enterochelin transport system substrate-binding protein